MVLAQENKCAMCGKAIAIRGYLHNNNNNKNQQESCNQRQNSSATTIIVEQIDGSSYTFDTADCALIFKKFKDVYGSNFGNE